MRKCKEKDWNGDKYIDCKNEPEVCEAHYNQIQTNYYNVKEKLSNRNHLVALLIGSFVLTLSVILFVNTENINENKFCLDKLNTYFPEYKFEKANYDSYTCVGTYTNPSLTRDGLQQTGLKMKESFKLINKEDINYLEKDDAPLFFAGFFFIISILMIILTITSWKES